jgi:serine/threonine protein kinase
MVPYTEDTEQEMHLLEMLNNVDDPKKYWEFYAEEIDEVVVSFPRTLRKLIQDCCSIDPKKRPTIEQLRKNEWVNEGKVLKGE